MLISTKLLHVGDIQAVLEDNLPQLIVKTQIKTPDIAADFFVKMSTNIGAKVLLRVHSFSLTTEQLNKLRDANIDASLIARLAQASIEQPVTGDAFGERLLQSIGAAKVKELFRTHGPQFFATCGVSSSVSVDEWDPLSLLGALTFGSSFHMSNRMTFQKQLFNLLAEKIEHLSIPTLPRSTCFVATAASGSANDPGVIILRRFRDEVLMHSRSGQWAIRVYSAVGPHLARIISRSRASRRVTYLTCVRPAARLVGILRHPGTERT